ncbi:DUF1700 domain-containing protein [Paratissierella segnis]|uniref:DUF1700 domain-containing protein n=1 Tax=Paratissierella segnis TaxID=2763679 RepID=A0A926EVD2_9FIRM|nr:DUF1700 domain-containing protein [Paratissierella segnis]MBC8589205.1 DUF1700 domain-containing protein [Paratissierella segnis]
MNRKEFIDKLKLYLQGMPESEIQDILSDYEEHFNIGISKGKSEEEIANELGEPKDIAEGYKTNYRNAYNDSPPTISYNTSNDTLRRALIIVLLIAFNVIIVLGPYIAVLGVLIAIYGIGIGLVFAGIGLFFGIPLMPFKFFGHIPNFHLLTTLSFGVGFGALGVLIIILAVILTKFIYRISIKYIKWNIELVNK